VTTRASARTSGGRPESRRSWRGRHAGVPAAALQRPSGCSNPAGFGSAVTRLIGGEMKPYLRPSRCGRVGALAAAAALLLLASGGTAGAEGRSGLGGFSAVAVASGQRSTFTVTKFLVIQ